MVSWMFVTPKLPVGEPTQRFAITSNAGFGDIDT